MRSLARFAHEARVFCALVPARGGALSPGQLFRWVRAKEFFRRHIDEIRMLLPHCPVLI